MAAGPLAYAFWHAPRTGVDAERYEEACRQWQAALGAHRPTGVAAAWTWSLEAPSWLHGWPDRAYLDFYVVADFATVGVLNEEAVSGPRRGPHDRIAGLAGHGSGALYARRSAPEGTAGAVVPARAVVSWYDKAPGTAYDEWFGRVSGDGRTLWLRQMVLGAGPELLVVTAPGTAPAPGALWSATADVL